MVVTIAHARRSELFGWKVVQRKYEIVRNNAQKKVPWLCWSQGGWVDRKSPTEFG